VILFKAETSISLIKNKKRRRIHRLLGCDGCSDVVGYRRFGWKCCLHLQFIAEKTIISYYCGTYCDLYFTLRTDSFVLQRVLKKNMQITTAVCKVRGLTLLLRVGTLWRREDSLFLSVSLSRRCTSYNAPPTSRKRAAARWVVRNFLPRSTLYMVGNLTNRMGTRSELNSVFGLENVDRWNPIRSSAIQSRSRPMRFLGFSNHEKGALRQEISKWSTGCSRFSRSGWSVVRIASLTKRGTSKKRPSPNLHEVPTRSNKVNTQIFKRTS
jgi:hypothetical protein